ncbi:2-amino-4-hydroxy-6-hydroxymethyldihydropteridine diphosphokinase [Apibacter sp. HY039]|uniref:2-amino-4-hydroxy-6- hydroxymethyldihydropteridine diphosphokinase n=1 Tax=Apibacter sp. HY039 TaxID=2501476 RepID=UPI000FEC0323|nr:2-amino-4-hydroxy-6-hydroxymethyldihydropteridine diphosphokinase [Apibacter sp. HY039]
MNKVILLLGSNLGDKKNNILNAIQLINNNIGKVINKTEIIRTEPFGYNSKNYYLNSGLELNTYNSPMTVLKKLKEIENKLGRKFDSSISGKYEDRTIDIDIVYFNNIVFLSKKLTIPHVQHITKRDFSQKILYQLI